MKQSIWDSLSLYEQISNIDGDVERLIRSHEAYLNHENEKDNSDYYIEHIETMIKMIAMDKKCKDKAYIVVELYDELNEIREYIKGNRDSEYIRRYWNAYTYAIS